ncbi:ATP-dependent helicase HrpB [Aestuariivirga sp.]|uniref:ATP-dependent helicase HrpB n=1 Tax=Aestuariivirga sp. TaxID=2650926 RepID=UPI0039E243CF
MDFPVDRVVPELAAGLAAHAAAVLVAEPGAGKTTRVPLALRDAAWLAGKKIVMLEPRRLAARASARRMAATLGETVGDTVGYTVRLERKVSARTRIEVVTEGILTRRLQQDPELADTGLVIFDEFHERSLDGDLGLALTLDVQRGLRPDLKMLVMSATLDAEALCTHLGNAPLIQTTGRMFPVGVTHLERPTRFSLIDDTVKAIARALREVKGSLLVFLPGEGEIRRTVEALGKVDLPANTDVRPLYGALSFADQDEAIRKPDEGRRKIVLATTIAETSLTIEGIEAVIDTGLKRAPRFDPASGMTALETIRVSQASAEQRKGRAGRLGPGHCYRLWPEAETKALAAHDEPEIRVADLAPLALDMANWGVTARDGLPWLEAPPQAPFAQAQDLLRQLGAVDATHAITAHGRAMVRLPLHPRLAHMVVKAAELGAGQSAAETAAMISERDGLPRDTTADIEARLLHVRGAARDRIRQSAKQITDLLRCGEDTSDLSHGVMLALAYPDRIAERRGQNRFRMANGGGAVVAEHDTLAKADHIAIALLDNAQADAKVFLAGVITLADIEKHFADLIITQSRAGWDSRQNAVVASTRRSLGAVVLEERALPSADPAVLAQGMVDGVRSLGLSALPWGEAAESLRNRVRFLARTMPDAGWPDLSDATLLATLEDWLSPYLAGMVRKSDLARLDMTNILRGLVPYQLLSQIDTLAPQRMEVPSGGHYRIDYETDGDPVLRVRLQEMFGLHSAPQVAGGRAKLRIELLSPAGRPVAVTQSLETFWTNAYPDVRKDMRGRYPKHYWPENPLEAQAVAPRRLR